MRITKNIRFILFFSFSIVVVIVLGRFGLLKPFESVFHFVFNPVQTKLYSWGLYVQNKTFIGDAEGTKSENEELKKQIRDLTVQNVELKNLISLSSEIEKQLYFIQENNFQALSAKVIAKSSEGLSRTLFINKGSDNNIYVGAPVITSDGIFIGKIAQVSPKSSQILLVTDNHSQVSGLIQNDTLSPGLVVGQHGLSMSMKFIPQLEPIKKDQTVITAGTEDFIPKGLVIGALDVISQSAGELFQEATIRMLVDYNKVEVVSIIIQPRT